MKISRNIDEKSIEFSIVDIDWIVKEKYRLLKSRYRLDWILGLDWIGLASLPLRQLATIKIQN